MYSEILLFENYRLFLTAALKEWALLEKVSMRKINKLCGFKSPNALLLICSGRRNLSKEGAKRVARALAKVFNASELQMNYFVNLVELNQCLEPTKWTSLFARLHFLRSQFNADILSEQKYGLYSHWANLVVRECLNCFDGQIDLTDLHKRLIPQVSAEQLQSSLDVLTQLGLITPNDDGYKIANSTIRTGDLFKSTYLIQFHLQMLDFGKQAIARFKPEERELGALTVGLSQEGLAKAKELVREFKDKVLELSETDDKKNRVFQIGLQIFPLSESIQKNELKAEEEIC